MEKRMMGLMLVLIIAVATFNILRPGDGGDRQGREVAILRTMGMSETGIVKIFMVLGPPAASSAPCSAVWRGWRSMGLNPLLDAVGSTST